MHGRAEPLRQFRKQGDASLRVEETAVTLKDGQWFPPADGSLDSAG